MKGEGGTNRSTVETKSVHGFSVLIDKAVTKVLYTNVWKGILPILSKCSSSYQFIMVHVTWCSLKNWLHFEKLLHLIKARKILYRMAAFDRLKVHESTDRIEFDTQLRGSTSIVSQLI